MTYAHGRLTATGHAGYAEIGKDIVCAAVSTLFEIVRLRFGGSCRSGNAALLFAPEDPTGKAVTAVLRELADAYPKHLCLKGDIFYP